MCPAGGAARTALMCPDAISNGAALFGAILAAGQPVTPGPGRAAAFDAVFRWTLPFLLLSLVLALIMRGKPLSEEMIEVAQGKAEVPEY